MRWAHLPPAPCCTGWQRDRRLASSCAQDHNLFIGSPSLRTCLCWSDRSCKESHSMITLVSIVKCSCTMDERSCSEINIFDRAVFGLVCAHAHSWSSSLATSRLSRWCLQICLCKNACVRTSISSPQKLDRVLLSYGFNSYRLRVNKLELELDACVRTSMRACCVV